MTRLIAMAWTLVDHANRIAPRLLPLLARIVFAGVLLRYFEASASTKFGTGSFGFLHPSDGAFLQIYPRLADALGYDFTSIGWFPRLVVVAGMLAEAILPVLIVLGALTRPAALAMIGFIVVQSITDVYGHGVSGADLGAWFDTASDALILDQRSFWLLLLSILVLMGGGAFSLDRLLARRFAKMR